MADLPNAGDLALKNIAEVTHLINNEIKQTADLVKPFTQYKDYRPHDPNPIGMHGTTLDEISSALRAIHTNLFALNKMLVDLVPKVVRQSEIH